MTFRLAPSTSRQDNGLPTITPRFNFPPRTQNHLPIHHLWLLLFALLLLPGCSKNNNAPFQDPTLSAAEIEQTTMGDQPPPTMTASFDGLGAGFEGPQGLLADCERGLPANERTGNPQALCNPSDNSLAVGPDHIVQIVNTRMAIFTKKGARFDTTGQVLYGPAQTRHVFKDFGGPCEEINNGDAVVRYDQLAQRWLIVMPIFRRLPPRETEPRTPRGGEPAAESMRLNENQQGYAGAESMLQSARPVALPCTRRGLVCHVLRDQRRPRPDGQLLPLRLCPPPLP